MIHSWPQSPLSHDKMETEKSCSCIKSTKKDTAWVGTGLKFGKSSECKAVVQLRTVPTIVIEHTFCASLRYSDFLSPMLTNTAIFLRGLKLSGESRSYSWYPKGKLGVTMHLWEIIKLQFEKERHTLLCILKLFTNIILELSLKNAWLPPIFFLDLNNTC